MLPHPLKCMYMPFVLSRPWAICLPVSYHDRDAYFMEATPHLTPSLVGGISWSGSILQPGVPAFKIRIILLPLHQSSLDV